MLISDMNFFQVEEYLQNDDRVILPIGSTEQHSYLSLHTDSILAQNVSQEVGDICNVPVFPVLSYGLARYFTAYAGTVTLTAKTYCSVICEILDSLYNSSFRRILIVNGHGGNSVVQGAIYDWLSCHEDARVIMHNWWAGKRVMEAVHSYDSVACHGSWMESFPWTKIKGISVPKEKKEVLNTDIFPQLSPTSIRERAGDGNFGGDYEKSEEIMLEIWKVAINETKDIVENGWV